MCFEFSQPPGGYASQDIASCTSANIKSPFTWHDAPPVSLTPGARGGSRSLRVYTPKWQFARRQTPFAAFVLSPLLMLLYCDAFPMT